MIPTPAQVFDPESIKLRARLEFMEEQRRAAIEKAKAELRRQFHAQVLSIAA